MTERARLTRAGHLVSITRLSPSGYYEVIKEIGGLFISRRFDTAAAAWRYYRHNREEN